MAIENAQPNSVSFTTLAKQKGKAIVVGPLRGS